MMYHRFVSYSDVKVGIRFYIILIGLSTCINELINKNKFVFTENILTKIGHETQTI